jgi:predicted dehydrogenase
VLRQDIEISLLSTRVLICGLGSIGKRHLRILRQHWPNLDIAVLRSGLGPACQEAKLANHIFTSLHDALAWKPEAAIIATPATDHLCKALPLARLGVPLLIEKPAGSGCELLTDWQELLNLAKSVPIAVAYVLRHDPCAAFVKHQLDIGKLGKIIEADFYCGSWLPDWRSGLDYREYVSARRDQGGGALLELSHELDLAQWLLGPIELGSSLLEQSGLLEIDVEDQAILVGRSEDGCSVTIRLNFCTKPARRRLTIRGSAGEIYWDIIDGNAEVAQGDTITPHTFASPISADERYYIQMKHFLSCAMQETRPMCSLAEGLKTLELVMQARHKDSGTAI